MTVPSRLPRVAVALLAAAVIVVFAPTATAQDDDAGGGNPARAPGPRRGQRRRWQPVTAQVAVRTNRQGRWSLPATGPRLAVSPDLPAPLQIRIAAAVRSAATPLAAFDAALCATGTGNYNLVRLSSVIPANSTVEVSDSELTPGGKWGDRLYTVYAEQRTATPGAQAWAGIGWIQQAGGGPGLFVEHEGATEAQVRGDIAASLDDLRSRRSEQFGPLQMVVTGGVCSDRPICALVIAAYQTASWR